MVMIVTIRGILLILKILHDLNILQSDCFRGIRYLGPCRISIHRKVFREDFEDLRV